MTITVLQGPFKEPKFRLLIFKISGTFETLIVRYLVSIL